MKKVQILGPGCPKCLKLAKNVEATIKIMGIECEIEKVTDINEILKFGVMITPALVVDGQIKTEGKLLQSDQIKDLLQEHQIL